MRSPSARILDQTCDIHAGKAGQDADGGPQWTYPAATASGVPCSVQAKDVEEMIDEQNRVTQYQTYHLMFASDPGVGPRDKITYTDTLGRIRTLFARATRDEAGRGAAFVVRAVEKI